MTPMPPKPYIYTHIGFEPILFKVLIILLKYSSVGDIIFFKSITFFEIFTYTISFYVHVVLILSLQINKKVINFLLFKYLRVKLIKRMQLNLNE